MSRRRKKNPLLMRILFISVIVHVIALPILAHFGAFEKIKRAMSGPTVIVVPPPPEEKQKAVAKKEQPKKEVARAKGSAQIAKSAHAQPSSPHPPVIAANVPAGDTGSSSAPSIETNGTGKVGVPPGAGTGTSTTAGGNGTSPQAREVPAQPQPEPEPKPEPPKPHTPVMVAAEPTFQPQPDIPDDLRSEAVDATTVVEIDVSPTGSPEAVKVSNSSGNPTLDQLALNTARRWRFKPATRDGQAIASIVRLHVQFKVEE